MSACPRVDDAVLYALAQMSPAEELAFKAHLETCVCCRLKAAEFRETVDQLPFAVAPVTPPADLKAKCMSRIAASPKTNRSRRLFTPAWGVAAAAFALLCGSYALIRVEGLTQRFAGLQRSAQTERSIVMEGTPAAPSASGRVVVRYEGEGTQVALQVQGLPQLEAGQAYQLWLVKDGQRTNGGVFVVDATGKGGVLTWLPGEISFDSLGVTREPDAYGSQPRGLKVMGSAT